MPLFVTRLPGLYFSFSAGVLEALPYLEDGQDCTFKLLTS